MILGKLNYNQALAFWRKNDAAKKDLDREKDTQGLSYGLYDDFPVWINRYYAFFQNMVIDRFLKQIPLDPDSRIAEIGCGSGRWCSKMLNQPHKEIIGTDIASHTLVANEKIFGKDITFMDCPATALELADSSVDLLYSVTVLHHLPEQAQVQAFAEIYRVLKPHGYFFFIESLSTDLQSPHIYSNTPQEWRSLIENSGFQCIDSVGQEYIDFRRIIRPCRRALKKKIVSQPKEKIEENQGQQGEGNIHSAGLTFAEQVFHLAFFPLVFAAYPLEFLFYKFAGNERANYICHLVQVKKS